MRIGEITTEWCNVCGHVDFFLGGIEELDDEGNVVYMGEALFCVYCNEDHPDNPISFLKRELEEELLCRGIMAL
jgi:hypothetical protein